MDLNTLLWLILFWSISTFPIRVQSELEGCPPPSKVAQALSQLQRIGWEEIPADRVILLWPTPLDEVKCSSQTPCRILVSKDRIISGHCQCCEAFRFSIDHTASGNAKERLDNVIIHYSATNKTEMVSAAKEIARGLGYPEDRIEEVGRNSRQRLEWSITHNGVKQPFWGETSITSLGSNWEFYFSISSSGQ